MQRLEYALALVIASWKLRPYFEAHAIIILTNYPLRQALSKPDTAGRLMRYVVEMGQSAVKYRRRNTIKGKALAHFIAEFTYPVPTGDTTPASKGGPLPLGGDPLAAEGDYPTWTFYVDGSSN